MNFHGAVIFVNNDLTPGVQGPLVRQLYISEVIDGTEFDLRVSVDPNYPAVVHLNNLRILVVRDFSDGYNRQLADVAIFIKAGLATIEANKFGPPGQTFDVDKLTIYELLMKYPLQGSHHIPPNIQTNIFQPLFPDKNKPKLYPYGSDGNLRRGGKGMDVKDDKDSD